MVALAMHKAFRRADMHNNIYREASGVTIIGSRTLLAGEYPRELEQSIACAEERRKEHRRLEFELSCADECRVDFLFETAQLQRARLTSFVN